VNASTAEATRLDKGVGLFVCFLVWALPSALFGSLAGWGAYAFDKQRLAHWHQTVNTPAKHVSVVTSYYHHGTPSIIAMSCFLGLVFAALSIACLAAACALWES